MPEYYQALHYVSPPRLGFFLRLQSSTNPRPQVVAPATKYYPLVHDIGVSSSMELVYVVAPSGSLVSDDIFVNCNWVATRWQ